MSALLRQKLVSHKGSGEAGREEFRHCVSHASLFSRVSFSKTLKERALVVMKMQPCPLENMGSKAFSETYAIG